MSNSNDTQPRSPLVRARMLTLAVAMLAVAAVDNAQATTASTGFGCASGSWGVVDGGVACVTTNAQVITAYEGKWAFVKVSQTSGWISSPAVQIVGEANDLRIDALTQSGSIVASCYLHTAGTTCDTAALSGSANAAYQSYYELPDKNGTLRDAAGLESANAGLGGSAVGTNGGDNYVVTAWFDSSNNVMVDIVGYFTSSTTASTSKLTALFASVTLTASQISSAANGTVFTASSWAP